MILSILIPTLEQRAYELAKLINEINIQTFSIDAFDKVEIKMVSDSLTNPNRQSTGRKRNELLTMANGEYVWFVDDDDMILPNAIPNILKALESKPDSLAINGIMTTDGGNLKHWYIAKDNPYEAQVINGQEVYLRYPNHITVIKKEIARKIGFPDKSNHEDFDFATRLKESGLIKVEAVVEEPVYHYQYKTYDKTYV